MTFAEQLGLEHPVVQAGMGGGIATSALAGAVSAAGGLGTVGILPPARLEAELRQARELACGGPVAANLLVPFAGGEHVDACARGRAAAVVLHAGFARALVDRLQERGLLVLHTVGTPEEARRALADGADGLVVQGAEAGGHLVGVRPALEALAQILPVAAGAPVLVAGGIATAEDARAALAAGAAAAVAGTRFLLTHESAAHPAYKQRVLAAERTLETRLFGLGWPMRHRVVPNRATDRWCRDHPNGPAPVRALNALARPLTRLPMQLVASTVLAQHPLIPVFSPSPPLVGMPERLIDASALYAGETALRIDSILSARAAVELLAGVGSGVGPGSPTIPSS